MSLWKVWRERREAREEDLEREVSTDLDLEAEEQMRAGVSAGEARRGARRAFGSTALVQEEVREAWGWMWLEQFWQDLRYGFRTLRKNAGFTLVAALSLALGIGGNAAMFSIVNGVLLQPLPYSQPDRLVRVTGYYPKGAVVALQQESRTMEVAGVQDTTDLNVVIAGVAQRAQGSAVSANLFSLLGAEAEMGSTFLPGQDHPGLDRVAIISEALWRQRFAGDPRAIGSVISVEGVGRQIVGVMPPGFLFPSSRVQLWIPLHLDPNDAEDYWGKGYMPLVARLRPGATLAQARAELHPLILHIITLFSFSMGRNWNSDASVLALQADMVSDARTRLLALAAAVGMVLLIACANVASLLLSRATARRKEIGLRSALGAARGRLVRQLLTESLALAIIGGLFGLWLAWGSLAILKGSLPSDTPRLAQAGIDWRVLAFMAMLTLFTGLLAGLVPAWSTSRLNLIETIKSGGQRATGTGGVRLRGLIITAEVALAVVLTVAAGLLTRSLWRMMQVNPGFNPTQLVAVQVSPDVSLCRQRGACVALYSQVLANAREINGVADVAAVNALPLSGSYTAVPVDVEGHPRDPGQSTAPLLWAEAVTPGAFRVLHIPILTGRAFTDGDGEKSDWVAVISASTARRYWPGENPIGKHLRVVWDQSWRTVVGVAADVHFRNLVNSLPDDVLGAVYLPYPQSVDLTEQVPATMNLLVRTGSDPGQVASQIRGLVRDLNPNIPVGDVRPLTSIVNDSTSQPRSLMWLFVSFAACALMLAAIGTYGVISYSTTQRTYEMGVRVALGASRVDIIGLVLGQSLRLVFTGLALGAGASLVLVRMMASLLYGVTASDPFTYLTAAVILLGVGLVAGFVPARRAANTDPLLALRAE